jgi:hypothetical protein
MASPSSRQQKRLVIIVKVHQSQHLVSVSLGGALLS